MIPATIIVEMITMSPMTIPKTVQVQSNSLLVLSVTEGVVASTDVEAVLVPVKAALGEMIRDVSDDETVP